MATMTFEFPTLPMIDEPAAQPWLDNSIELALAFSHDVHGAVASRHVWDTMLIYLAAARLWITSDRKPCWGRLDIDDWLTHVELLHCHPELRESAAMTMRAFYTFLVKRRHLSATRAQPCIGSLWPHLPLRFRELVLQLERGAPRRRRRVLH